MAGLTVGIAGSGIQIISLGPCLSILLSLEFTSFSSRPFPCVKKDGAEQFQAYIILTASEAKERRPESLPLHHTGHHKWPIFPSLGRISTAQWGGKSSTTNRRTETTHPIFFSWKNHTHKTKEKFSEKSECFNIFCKYHFCLAWKKTEQCSYLIFINNLLWHAILVELYQEIWLYTEIYLEKWQITDPMKEVRKAKESSHHTWEPLFLKIIEKVYIKIP